MEEFIDDIRNLAKQRDFTEGNIKQKDHLNELVTFANGLKEAADRAVENVSKNKFDGYIVDDGVSTLYELHGKPKA